jgi:8-oxo-dGTP pyrophosphatase MutT (NUDIX family)
MDQISAGGVAFRWTHSEPEIAIVSVKPKLRWQLPKGIVDPGESPEMTAVREVREEAGEQMMRLVHVYRELLRQTPVDELEIRERPVVHFRASENTWLDAIVRYLIHPKESGRVKTRIIKKLLDKLNDEPERVLFPKSNLR